MSTARPILTSMTLVLFVAMAIFGLGISMNNMDISGNMSNCPLMNGMLSICRMNAFEHIGAWQSVFTATIPMLITLLLLALTLLFVSSLLVNLSRANLLKGKFLSHRRQNPSLQLFDHLRLAFRAGILHPKVFNFASISH